MIRDIGSGSFVEGNVGPWHGHFLLELLFISGIKHKHVSFMFEFLMVS